MQQTSTKRVPNLARLGGKVIHLEIVQEIQIWLYYQMVYTQIVFEKESLRIFWDF